MDPSAIPPRAPQTQYWLVLGLAGNLAVFGFKLNRLSMDNNLQCTRPTFGKSSDLSDLVCIYKVSLEGEMEIARQVMFFAAWTNWVSGIAHRREHYYEVMAAIAGISSVNHC